MYCLTDVANYKCFASTELIHFTDSFYMIYNYSFALHLKIYLPELVTKWIYNKTSNKHSSIEIYVFLAHIAESWLQEIYFLKDLN